MAVPSADNKVWLDIVTGKKNVAFTHLGIKMFMGRIGITLRTNPEKAPLLAKELYSLFQSNIASAKVVEDLKQL